jgi:hypothetical protein
MSTWMSIYRVVRACHYNAGNAPIQPLHPKTQWSRGYYGLLIFTMISVSDQLQLDMCPLVGRPHLGGALTACDLRDDLPIPQPDQSFAAEWGSPSCKTNKGASCCIIGEVPRHEVKLCRASPYGLRSASPTPFMQNYASKQD